MRKSVKSYENLCSNRRPVGLSTYRTSGSLLRRIGATTLGSLPGGTKRALYPSTGYKIMSFGMRNGSFTGVRRSDIINGSQYAYLNARRIVNGNDRAELIQGYPKSRKLL